MHASSLPIAVEPVNVSLRTSAIGGELGAHGRAASRLRHDVHDTRRNAGARGELRNRQRRVRRLMRRLAYESAPAASAGAALRVSIAAGKVPRRDRRHHADGLHASPAAACPL